MEIPLLKSILNSISGFFHLSSRDNLNSELVSKYYEKIEEILKFFKTILGAIIDAEIVSDEMLQKAFAGLSHSVDELRELFDNCRPLMSRVYFVLQVESITSKLQACGLEICEFLKSSEQYLPEEFSVAILEQCIQKLKHTTYLQLSPTILKAIEIQAEGFEVSSDCITKVSDSLSLNSNQELLVELVSLEKLKETAEQAENSGEVEYIDQLIALVTYVHESFVTKELSNFCSPVPIPEDFCCPLSLQLMTDPVIVASGQTYDRYFIQKWFDLGLNVCPKTRQTLVQTNLVPNYTVKQFIASWCETNNVKLPDPKKSGSLKQLSPVNSDSATPRDFRSFSHTSRDHSASLDSSQLPGSSRQSLVASDGMPQDGFSPSHAYSSSENSLPGDGHGLDMDSTAIGSSEEILVTPRAPSVNPNEHLFMAPPGNNALGPDEQSSQGHNGSTTDSSMLTDSKFSQELQVADAPVEETSYSIDSSGDTKIQSKIPWTLTVPRVEPESQSRLETRHLTNAVRRRPSKRFSPMIISSPSTETWSDLSDVESRTRKLVEDLGSSSLDVLRKATEELRLLSRNSNDNRIIIANCGAIGLLVGLLRSPDTKVQQEAVTALLNLSIDHNNKMAIAKAEAIEPLIHVLRTGSPEAKENSAATLFSLSVNVEIKAKIGRSGAIEPLVDLLESGTPRGKKDAATALFNLSLFNENKPRIVEAGAVKCLVELMDPAAGVVDKAVAVLANLSTTDEGREAIGQEGGIPPLVEVVELGSARGKENAAAALLQLCNHSNRFCNMVLQEGAVPPLAALSQSGTPRAREKAHMLLSFFKNHQHGNANRN